MRAERLLTILLLLQTNRRLTARELAERLEVSERTIQRDMEALSSAGIPVIAERGTGGGWMLMEGYRTNLTGLKPDEIMALFSSQPIRLLKDLGLHEAAETGLLKLLAALPSVFRRSAEYVRQRIFIDTSGWQRTGEDVGCLPALQDAVLRERKIDIEYERGDGTSVERRVDPLGLVAKGSAWYLVAAVEGEKRTYRISRIREARLTDESFERPEPFDLAAFWERTTVDFVDNLPRYTATLRADASIMHRLRWAGRFARVERIDAPDDEGWSKVAIRFETIQEACEYVLGFGPFIEVVEPDELRMEVIRRAKSVTAFYERKYGPQQ